MSIPDFQTMIRPLLEIAADGAEHSTRETNEILALQFKLTPEERTTRPDSGGAFVFINRVGWAKSHLVQAGALLSRKRGVYQITDLGREILRQGHDRITIKVLSQYSDYTRRRVARQRVPTSMISPGGNHDSLETPDEMLFRGYQTIRDALAAELLQKVKENSPRFFEGLVVDLMVAMGYGGTRRDAGDSIGQSGDEGVDGIIKEDMLGLDVIYLQAKRWQGTVGRPEIQKFVGALSGKRAKKGVFITTGSFTSEAQSYANSIETKVILIDGHDLANHMIDFNVGTSTQTVYEIKRIDSDYFNEEV